MLISKGELERGSQAEHEVAEVQLRQGDVQVVHLFTLLEYVPTGQPSYVG